MDPTQQGVVKWSARRAHQHLQAVIPAAIFIPIAALFIGQFVALPKKPTTADRIAQGAESLIAGVLVVGVLALLYAVLVAPYEQRNALRRQLTNTVGELGELRNSIHETLRLDRVEIGRNVPHPSRSADYDLLRFAMLFQNTATVPIKYSVQRLSPELNGQMVNIDVNRDMYRLAAGGWDRYQFDVHVNPPQSGQAICILDYCVWYGPISDPYMYEQEYRMRCTSSPTLDPTTSDYRSTRLQGGHDRLREAKQ